MLSGVEIPSTQAAVSSLWGYANANATVVAIAIVVIAMLGVSYVILRWTIGPDFFRPAQVSQPGQASLNQETTSKD